LRYFFAESFWTKELCHEVTAFFYLLWEISARTSMARWSLPPRSKLDAQISVPKTFKMARGSMGNSGLSVRQQPVELGRFALKLPFSFSMIPARLRSMTSLLRMRDAG
jgi:hypothetical protein